jgi:hypothetical protein
VVDKTVPESDLRSFLTFIWEVSEGLKTDNIGSKSLTVEWQRMAEKPASYRLCCEWL